MKLGKFRIIAAACSAADHTRGSFISHAKYHLKERRSKKKEEEEASIKACLYMLL